MSRLALTVTSLAILAGTADVHANWFTSFIEVCDRDFKRNNCWPRPFVQPAREATKAPFFAMIDNGWRQQNLLGDHYFDASTNALTAAGELKVRWIVTQLPPPRRALFVQRGLSPDSTWARLNAVREVVVNAVPEGNLPPIWETGLQPVGSPADYLERVDQGYLETMPEPRLPEVKRVETSL